MVVYSAGILLHRPAPTGPEVLLGHMGGPFWARKDAGAWSLPKGEHGPDDDPLTAAVREFTEELGTPPPAGSPVPLGTVRQPSGKRLTVFALAGDLDADAIVSNTFAVEWPPRLGADAGVPRDRPCRLVRPRRGPARGRPRSGAVPGPARRPAGRPPGTGLTGPGLTGTGLGYARS